MTNSHQKRSFAFVLLKTAKGFFEDIVIATRVAFFPTLRAIRDKPKLLLEPHTLSRIFMANVWVRFGDSSDANYREVKEGLVTEHAKGVVLDVGAGEPSLSFRCFISVMLIL